MTTRRHETDRVSGVISCVMAGIWACLPPAAFAGGGHLRRRCEERIACARVVYESLYRYTACHTRARRGVPFDRLQSAPETHAALSSCSRCVEWRVASEGRSTCREVVPRAWSPYCTVQGHVVAQESGVHYGEHRQHATRYLAVLCAVCSGLLDDPLSRWQLR